MTERDDDDLERDDDDNIDSDDSDDLGQSCRA